MNQVVKCLLHAAIKPKPTKQSHFSSLNALSSLKFLFKKMVNVECMVNVPLMLNEIFIVYVNFMIFGFIQLPFMISFM